MCGAGVSMISLVRIEGFPPRATQGIRRDRGPASVNGVDDMAGVPHVGAHARAPIFPALESPL
jgi:hypothetical protein